MRKNILTALIFTALASFSAIAQTYGTGELIRSTNDVVTTTNGTTYYTGFAKTYTAYSTPSPNAAVWKIVRTQYDTNGVFVGSQNAYNTSLQGTNAIWGNVWTNRVNATYK